MPSDSSGAVTLAGTRVLLRPVVPEDVEALVASRSSDPGFAASGGAAREQLVKQIERRPTLEDGGFLALAIEAGGEIVGDIQARAPKHGFPPGVCELGITLFPEHRGKGYGLEAVLLLTEHLLDAGWPRVQASTAVGNAAMRRVLHRADYVYEGILHSFAPGDDGSREDYVIYARFRSGDSGDRTDGGASNS